MAGWFYRAMHREPVVMWSCAIGGLGMALPAIVPRELVEIVFEGWEGDARGAERGGGGEGAATVGVRRRRARGGARGGMGRGRRARGGRERKARETNAKRGEARESVMIIVTRE